MNSGGNWRNPNTWANGLVVGATALNYNLSDNIRQLDNFVNPQIIGIYTVSYDADFTLNSSSFTTQFSGFKFVPWTKFTDYGSPVCVRIRAVAQVQSSSNPSSYISFDWYMYQETIPSQLEYDSTDGMVS